MAGWAGLLGAVLVAAAFAGGAVAGVPGSLPPGPSLRDLGGGPVVGPRGWADWCDVNAGLCERGEPSLVVLDAATAAVIERVFHAVRGRITAAEDPPGQDIWRVVEGQGTGDCEDYALTWREALVALGLPRGALDIAVVETERGEIHAVLAVQTDRNTLILDNRHTMPRAWTTLPYRWLAIEPHAEAAFWAILPDYRRIGAEPPLTAQNDAGG